MKQVRFKDKGRKGQVLGLGTVTHEWKDVPDNQIQYFEQLNTRVSAPDDSGKREVLAQKSLTDYGIEVRDAPEPKSADKDKKEDSK